MEVEVFDQASNAWILRTPGRQFPAIAVQGDSLSTLVSLAQSILDRARSCACADGELAEEAEELRDLLGARLELYEAVLRREGIPLPYNRAGGTE